MKQKFHIQQRKSTKPKVFPPKKLKLIYSYQDSSRYKRGGEKEREKASTTKFKNEKGASVQILQTFKKEDKISNFMQVNLKIQKRFSLKNMAYQS